jgi:hypothetical protein
VGDELRRLQASQIAPENVNLNESEKYIKETIKRLKMNNLNKIGFISTLSEIDSTRMKLNNAFPYNSISSIIAIEQVEYFCNFHKYDSEFSYILIKDLDSFPNGMNTKLVCNNWVNISDDELRARSLNLFKIDKDRN